MTLKKSPLRIYRQLKVASPSNQVLCQLNWPPFRVSAIPALTSKVSRAVWPSLSATTSKTVFACREHNEEKTRRVQRKVLACMIIADKEVREEVVFSFYFSVRVRKLPENSRRDSSLWGLLLYFHQFGR